MGVRASSVEVCIYFRCVGPCFRCWGLERHVVVQRGSVGAGVDDLLLVVREVWGSVGAEQDLALVHTCNQHAFSWNHTLRFSPVAKEKIGETHS